MTARVPPSWLRQSGKKPVKVETVPYFKPGRPGFGLDKDPTAKRGRYVTSSPERRACGGIVFDSLAEMKHYNDLKLRERIGEIERDSIELQPRFDLVVNGVAVGFYRCDFAYRVGGETIFVEVKSDGTAREKDWRLRRKLAEALYGVKIVEVRI